MPDEISDQRKYERFGQRAQEVVPEEFPQRHRGGSGRNKNDETRGVREFSKKECPASARTESLFKRHKLTLICLDILAPSYKQSFAPPAQRVVDEIAKEIAYNDDCVDRIYIEVSLRCEERGDDR